MFDRTGIYWRFAECHDANYQKLAEIFGLSYKTTHHWQVGRGPIPWKYLKSLVDDQCLRWDWLIDGTEPKKRKRCDKSAEPFNRHEINQRFLSLFPGMSQAKIAKELGFNQTTVFKWCHDMAQVPWEQLRYAVETKGVTWEWLLEGR
ncbi:MAG: helix-turn-helix domain-containing protein [Planctomycetes bacterium]|nr:helix-turn-helix domain-containing protein [Planctomycetota bacterium]MCC8116533.1 helix-turn-helix domain-containing protein [Planctomycetota bacterium]